MKDGGCSSQYTGVDLVRGGAVGEGGRGRPSDSPRDEQEQQPSLPCAKPSTLRGPWHHMGAAADEREHEQQAVSKYAQASYWHHMGAAA